MADILTAVPLDDGEGTGAVGSEATPPSTPWDQAFLSGQSRYTLVLNTATGFYEFQAVDGPAPFFGAARSPDVQAPGTPAGAPTDAGFVFQHAPGSDTPFQFQAGASSHDGPGAAIPTISDPLADVLNHTHGGTGPAVLDPGAGDGAKGPVLSKPAILAHPSIFAVGV